jgi:adenine/guanine phosphoribosyltransferase-like PRPP-binding protein
MNVKQGLIERDCLFYSGQNGLPACHWVGVSDMHLGGYFCADQALRDANFMGRTAYEMARPFAGRVNTVLAPAIGGISIGTLVADRLVLLSRNQIFTVFGEKVEGSDGETNFALLRPGSAEAVDGADVLVVDDMINRKHTVNRLIRLAKEAGGRVVGVSTMAANSDVRAEDLDTELVSLCEVAYPTWSPEQCAQEGPCSRREPIVVDKALGHGAKFQAEQPDYPGGFINLLG